MVQVPLSTYYYLLPEIIVALTGVVLIVADLIWPAHDEATGHTGTWPAYVAIFGLLAAAAAGALVVIALLVTDAAFARARASRRLSPAR